MSTDPSPACDLLAAKKCVPCEGGVPKLSPAEAESLRAATPDWRIVNDGERIRREWSAKHFRAVMEFVNEVARVAEEEQHHPDIHVTGYRQVAVEIFTHAIGGLSENDFILAAKIDRLPIRLKA
jgi:4a-hydroxytetrahydrobiopterin dehydratase